MRVRTTFIAAVLVCSCQSVGRNSGNATVVANSGIPNTKVSCTERDASCFIGRTMASELTFSEPTFKMQFRVPAGWMTDTVKFRSQGVGIAWFPIADGRIDEECVIYFRHFEGATTDDILFRAATDLSRTSGSPVTARELSIGNTPNLPELRYFEFSGFRDGRNETAAYAMYAFRTVFFVLTCPDGSRHNAHLAALTYFAENSIYELGEKAMENRP